MVIPADVLLARFITVIIAGLAVYRLAYLVTKEYGPFDVFKKWRGFWAELANKAQARGRAVALTATIAELFHCPYCLGMWLALVAAAILLPDSWFLHWLAIAGVQSFMQGIVHKS